MRRIRIVSVAIALAAVTVPSTGAQASGVIRLDFQKEVIASNTWSGTAGQDGAIRTTLTNVTETGNVWHVTFDWHVFEVPTPFDAVVSGVLNLGTGVVSLNGVVVGGDLDGSRVHVNAQLDLDDFSSEGTMTITP